ncbi:ABC transporter C family member 10 [Camellia lanceoleosa]|uniref:ABC transporter C family member 10 n=1 Tax=Camellia lanceoleosa TaxID=1840588 RepID=A0ACC0GZJ7_9ERIC|nr:ABC transporter C family member 10 [Camellia lanceoleosa]
MQLEGDFDVRIVPADNSRYSIYRSTYSQRLTLSTSPLILNTFIEWARDNRILGGDNSYCALQWPLAKLQHKFQSKLMVGQDDRQGYFRGAVNMKVLKLYAWESHFKNVIENLGKVECKWLSAVQMHKAYNGSLFWASPVLVSTATFGACYFLGLPFYASNVFTFVATLRLVQEPVRCIPYVIAVVIQAKVAFARIVIFLQAPELQNTNIRKKRNMGMKSHSIFIKSASFSWEESLLKPMLRNINLEV